jgi:hypothetical protein
VRGRSAEISCVDVLGLTFEITAGPVRTLRLQDEWFEDVPDPDSVLRAVRGRRDIGADVFTFWQRVPELNPRFSYHVEWEDIAVLPVSTYEEWLTTRLNAKNRNRVRKAERSGVEVREVPFDDDFLRGMFAIFNESPIRQGRAFWHYGKSLETLKSQFSRYLYRESMIGAYYAGEMIGFIMLADAGAYAMPGQIISSLRHRDKSTNNALIAKAVQVCETRGFGHLVYYHWGEGSLAEFKRHCGFERTRVPRYFVPLTATGRLAMRCGAHRGPAAMLPDGLRKSLKDLRTRWLHARYGTNAE